MFPNYLKTKTFLLSFGCTAYLHPRKHILEIAGLAKGLKKNHQKMIVSNRPSAITDNPTTLIPL